LRRASFVKKESEIAQKDIERVASLMREEKDEVVFVIEELFEFGVESLIFGVEVFDLCKCIFGSFEKRINLDS
jgi:hypothetical protein